ncbi:hypothetical protein Q5P01_021939 [Channa striata]|uniref:Uncharacterized protein n=1 Tax=Channa striata TaxID=64152 RepID=A0AA88IX21_CHASR|nr:hypothetical protein Q5P01_021939 [Channa striata]
MIGLSDYPQEPRDRTKSSSKGQGISRDRSSVRSRKTSRENPGRRARTPVDRTNPPLRAREQNGPSVRITRVYRNLRVEGSVSNTVHANLRKIGVRLHAADTAESSFTDLGPSVQFDQDIGEDLGVHLSTQDSAGVTVYTEKDYLHSHRDKRGVLILAPNFIDPQGDANFAPATSISRPATPRSSPIDSGSAQSTRQGLSDHRQVCLPGPKHRAPIGGWYFGTASRSGTDRQRRDRTEKQTEFGVARARRSGDL